MGYFRRIPGLHYWEQPRQLQQQIDALDDTTVVVVEDVETLQTEMDAAQADLIELEPIGPTPGQADRRFNDYLITGVAMPFPTADIGDLPEGWFLADDTDGTVDFSLIVLPVGMSWVQMVGPYPS